MPKFHIKGQIARLLGLEWFNAFQLGGSLWVLLLAARGFSLAEIGLAEGFFHLVSLCCEVPSGLLADVLGRRKTLLASQTAFGLSALMMLASQSLLGVCLALGLDALGFNLSSGTREALTYDSLVQHGLEERYLRLSSVQTICYRLGAAAAMLCAGWALSAGHRICYSVDVAGAVVCFLLAWGLAEPEVTENQQNRASLTLGQLPGLLLDYIRTAVRFLKEHPPLCVRMLGSSLAGSVATLMTFFLQEGLPAAGAPAAILGLLLVAMQLGRVAGAWLGARLGKLPYRLTFWICTVGTVVSALICALPSTAARTMGGVLIGLFDESLFLVTDARLNEEFPSDQRATLVSIESLLFSVVMIGMSPLLGRLTQLVF
ncbi:MAG: MFS transporter [Oscillospiraceae bacterium]|nr:MFS transporter [Oscillospiraceae bacterium]